MGRTPAAGLIVAVIIVIAALVVSLVAALGVALIGLLLSRWFELTQWQGSVLAVGALVAVTLLVYRLLDAPRYIEPDWLDFEDEDEEPEPPEPPIVPWRRQRPSQGEPPAPSDRKRK
jgi:hypothetical protein